MVYLKQKQLSCSCYKQVKQKNRVTYKNNCISHQFPVEQRHIHNQTSFRRCYLIRQVLDRHSLQTLLPPPPQTSRSLEWKWIIPMRMLMDFQENRAGRSGRQMIHKMFMIMCCFTTKLMLHLQVINTFRVLRNITCVFENLAGSL